MQNPSIKTLHKIALAFDMTLAEFPDFDELNDYSFDDDSDDKWAAPTFASARKVPPYNVNKN